MKPQRRFPSSKVSVVWKVNLMELADNVALFDENLDGENLYT